MVDHHVDLAARNRSGRMPWMELCATFAEMGLKDGKGKPPTPKRAGETWRLACAEVKARADEAQAAKQAAPRHRSRPQDSWRPSLTTAPATSPPPVPSIRRHNGEERHPRQQTDTATATAPPPEAAGNSPLDDLPPEVKAKFDRLRQDFAETDRKRFGRF
jgi:hypothetical protein